MREITRRPYKLIPLSEVEEIEDFTSMSVHTLRNWRTQKKHLELFIPIEGKIFLDCREWIRLVRKAKRESVREAKRMRELIG